MIIQQFKDRVSLHGDRGHYNGSLEDFKRHYGKALPQLPDGIDHRVYEPGKRHALSADGHVRDGGPMPWREGDVALEKIDAIIKARHDEDAALLEAKRKEVRDAHEAEAKAKRDKAEAELQKQAEQHRAQAEAKKREADKALVVSRANREQALNKLKALLQRLGAEPQEVQEITDVLWPKPKES